jgi:hypothetical protein
MELFPHSHMFDEWFGINIRGKCPYWNYVMKRVHKDTILRRNLLCFEIII